MDYILLLVKGLSGGSDNVYLSHDLELKVIFVAVVVILVVIMFMSKSKS
jgi:hypothetical protein